MAQGRRMDQWSQTAAVLAMLANVNRNAKRSRVYVPADFNPYTKEIRRRGEVTTNLGPLRKFFEKE